jgi:dihydrofolate reductase
MQEGLVDELRVMVNPVILGQGTPLFKGVNERINLKLSSTRVFRNGNVMLNYQVVGLP